MAAAAPSIVSDGVRLWNPSGIGLTMWSSSCYPHRIYPIWTYHSTMPDAVEPPLTPAAFLVLLAIAAGRSHGYAVMRHVEDVSGGAVRLGPGTLYRSIGRLVADGL